MEKPVSLIGGEEQVLDPPEEDVEFKFPFTPYPIQKDFMRALFTALEGRKLGIFESPTGTGKSLSMLCGSLTWLEKREEAHFEYLQGIVNSVDLEGEERRAKDAENWITAQVELRQKRDIVNAAKRELQFLQGNLEKRKKYLSKRTSASGALDRSKWRQKSSKKPGAIGEVAKKRSTEDELNDLLLNDDFAPEYGSGSDLSDGDNDEEPEFYANKIIFASRTHSQLGQFAKELKRTAYASKVTTCSLGSRQNLCINPDVTKLKNLSLMNERCLELQKGSKGKKTSETKKMKGCGGCSYFNQIGIDELKSEILSEPMDIEDLVSAGKDLNACPYYASRKASKEAQLVLLPYNTILHKSTREGVGISVKNSVLLLDEAHNIVESISNMYSTTLSLQQMEECSEGLKTYMARYRSRFNPKHLLKLKQLAFILKALAKFVGSTEPKEVDGSSQHVFTVQEFKNAAGIENLDIYELESFVRKTKLIFKLKGYLVQHHKIAEKTAQLKAEKTPLVVSASQPPGKGKISTEKSSKTVSKPIQTVENTPPFSKPSGGQSILNFAEFLKSLLGRNSSGRVIRDGSSLKFLLLSTSDHFGDLLNSARSIILAGGTMKPYDEVEDQLFQAAKQRLFHFSCDHVIPDENLVCISLKHGPTQKLLDFTYQSRKKPETLEELSRTITNVSKLVPGGLVIFLPSYDYESLLHTYLKSSGYFAKIEARKKIFREPKDSSCDAILTDYSRQIKNSQNGAVLFAVVGGKLSEGINFSDDLGRCVMVVGLPYPNVTGVEIKEKVRFVSERFGNEKGSQLLDTMCSKAVNQSIGRAIRHCGDYAAIILVDHRFSYEKQQKLLPNWIFKRYQVANQFGDAVTTVAKFFNGKKK